MIKDLACGLVTMVIAAIYLSETTKLRSSLLGDVVGPAGFPKIIGWGMAIAGLLLAAQSLWTLKRGKAAAGPSGWLPSEAFAAGAGRATARAAGVVAIIIVYLVLFYPLGYPLSVAIMLASMSVFLGAPANWGVVVTAVAGALVLWLLFGFLLKIPFPAGFLADYF